VLTHTRWHRDDLAGRLLRKMVDRGTERWDILCLPAVREEGPGPACDPRQPGEALWKEFNPHYMDELTGERHAGFGDHWGISDIFVNAT
jgi:hypothetical protein